MLRHLILTCSIFFRGTFFYRPIDNLDLIFGYLEVIFKSQGKNWKACYMYIYIYL